MADRLGRRKLSIVTLGVCLLGNALTALSMNFAFFAVTRFIAGTGTGGEYAALNSAIDELIPSRYRGHADLAINGTYWLGAMIGAAANLAFLNPDLFAIDLGWRLGLLLGPAIGLAIWGLRRNIPESPRWLLTHGIRRRPSGSWPGSSRRWRRAARAWSRCPRRRPWSSSGAGRGELLWGDLVAASTAYMAGLALGGERARVVVVGNLPGVGLAVAAVAALMFRCRRGRR